MSKNLVLLEQFRIHTSAAVDILEEAQVLLPHRLLEQCASAGLASKESLFNH